MPQDKTSTSTKRNNPYGKSYKIASATSSPTTYQDDIKPDTTSFSPKNKGKPWTGDELKALFHHAIKHSAPGSDGVWEGVVPGRTGGQCRSAWR